MPKILMTEGPMSGRVINVLDPHEAADVLDRGYGEAVVEKEAKPKPEKSTRAKRVRQKRKAERATVPIETPEA